MRRATPLPSIVRFTGAPRTSCLRFPGTSIALAARARTSATLLRRIDAIFAYRDALGHELAVVAHARAGEDVRAGLEVVARPGPEGVVLGLGVHQDLLLAFLGFHGELATAARLRDVLDVGIGHHRVRDRVPGAVHLRHLR